MTKDEFQENLDNLLIQAGKNKTEDEASSDDRRRWAIVYTELEKVKAYVAFYLEEAE